MRFFITLRKRHLAIFLAAIIVAFLTVGQIISAKARTIDGSTNAIRVEYIKGLGIEPDDSDVAAKEIVIPETFSDVYKKYNSLQKKAGFDLSLHKGEKAVVYTYSIAGDDREVHIIVADGKIIGGDIAEINVNGEMKPLK